MHSIFKVGMRDPFSALWDTIGAGEPSLWTHARSWAPSSFQHELEKWQALEDGSVQLKMQLPGVPREAIELCVEDRTLVLVADGAHEKSCAVSRSRVERRWTLLDSHDAEDVRSELRDGILTITVPAKQQQKPARRSISIG